MAAIELTSGKAGSIYRKAAVGEFLADTKAPGFGVLVGKNLRTYVVRFRVRGEPTQYTRRLGDIKKMRLADARAEAVRVKGLAHGTRDRPGRHPDQDAWDAQAAAAAAAAAEAQAQEVQEAEAAKAAALTFKVVADRFLADRLKGGGANLKSRDELERKLNKDLAIWHDRSIKDIDFAEIDRLIREKAEAHGVAGNRLCSFVKQVFNYAMKRALITVNPAAKVEKPFEEPERERALSEDEIRVVWWAADRLGGAFGRLVKLLLVTGQRRGEVAGMRRSEMGVLRYDMTVVDAATLARTVVKAQCPAWLIPAERMKGGKPHSVPLSSLAQELIDGAPVLTDAKDNRPLDHVLASGDAGDHPISGWSKFRRQLDVAVAEELAEEAGEEVDLKRHRLPPFHLHDLRASVSTLMEQERGVPEQVIGRVLAHSPGGRGRTITRGYLRSPWHAEAVAALEDWASELRRIVGLNVEPIDKRRGA